MTDIAEDCVVGVGCGLLCSIAHMHMIDHQLQTAKNFNLGSVMRGAFLTCKKKDLTV